MNQTQKDKSTLLIVCGFVGLLLFGILIYFMTKKKEKFVDCQSVYYPDLPEDQKSQLNTLYTEINSCSTDANCPGYVCDRTDDQRGVCKTQDGATQKRSEACKGCGNCPQDTPNSVSCAGKSFCCKDTVCNTDNTGCCDPNKIYDSNKCCSNDLCGTNCCDLNTTECVDASCCPKANVYNDNGAKKCCPNTVCGTNCCQEGQTCTKDSTGTNDICCNQNKACGTGAGARCCSNVQKCVDGTCRDTFVCKDMTGTNSSGQIIKYRQWVGSDSDDAIYNPDNNNCLTYYCDQN